MKYHKSVFGTYTNFHDVDNILEALNKNGFKPSDFTVMPQQNSASKGFESVGIHRNSFDEILLTIRTRDSIMLKKAKKILRETGALNIVTSDQVASDWKNPNARSSTKDIINIRSL